MNITTLKKLNRLLGNTLEAKETFETLRDELQDKLDSRSDRYLESDKASQDEEDISNLEDVIDELDDLESALGFFDYEPIN